MYFSSILHCRLTPTIEQIPKIQFHTEAFGLFRQYAFYANGRTPQTKFIAFSANERCAMPLPPKFFPAPQCTLQNRIICLSKNLSKAFPYSQNLKSVKFFDNFFR